MAQSPQPNMAQLPQPNVDNLVNSLNGMATEGAALVQNIQAYGVHQQNVGAELVRFANIPVINQQQQLTAIQNSLLEFQASVTNSFHELRTSVQDLRTSAQATTREIMAFIAASNWNLRAMMEHGRVHNETQPLIHMRIVDQNQGDFINQPIPGFPATVEALDRMNAAQCRIILTALDLPHPDVPGNNNEAVRTLRRATRKAIGFAV